MVSVYDMPVEKRGKEAECDPIRILASTRLNQEAGLLGSFRTGVV